LAVTNLAPRRAPPLSGGEVRSSLELAGAVGFTYHEPAL
jgi:hypothetical protein